MGEDIVPGLLSDITEEFRRLYEESGEIQGLLHEVRSGTATYEEARDYAKAVSGVTGEAWQKYVTAETLPDGRMYFNIASRLVPAKLDENYGLVSEYARDAQEALNRKAGVGLKAQTPKENQDRVNGLVELAAEAEEYAEVEGRLLAGMENFSLNIVDEAVRLNADFQYSAGMRPQVVRRVNRPCCAWCAALEGVYDYAEVKKAGSDVWRRHLNCDCLIEYVPATGRRETVSNYRLPEDQKRDRIEERKRSHKESLPLTRRLKDETIKMSVGAKAKNYDILDLATGERYHLAEGSRLQNITVFAGAGTRTKFRDAEKYVERYGGHAAAWQHAKGIGVVATEDGDRLAEIHWVYHAGIGKKEMFVKRWLDES